MKREEAIEIIKKNYPDSNFTMLREALETLIPELKGSEDERIRNEIIDFIYDKTDTYELREKSNSWLAWLEKQGEHANFLSKIQIGDKVTRNEAGILVNISQLNRVAKSAKRQDEQKLADEEMQNSAWSEKDKIYLSYAIHAVEDMLGNNGKNTVTWLKSLKDRVLLKPEQEWGEEDKKKINYLIALLQNSTMHNSALRTANEGIEKWLKSLKDRVQPQNCYNPYKEVVESIAEMCKHYDVASHSGLRDFYNNVKVKCKDAKEYDSLFPQNTWKPSDEQIKDCKEVYADILSAKGFDLDTVNSELNRMEEQLKNLREE